MKKETVIKDLLSDIFSRGVSFGDRVLAVLVILVLVGTVGLVAMVVFGITDSAGIIPTKTEITTVETKQIRPAYTTMMLVGKVMIPQFHPESYSISFKIEGKEASASVSKSFLDVVHVGDGVEVSYGFGRLSKSLIPTHIRQVR